MSWVWVGVGAAVGATAGAIKGSEKGGDDVWKQALGGAALGGAAGAGGYAAFGAEAAAPAVVAEGVLPAGELVAGGTGIAGVGMNAAAPIAGTSATMLPGATSPLVGATAETAAGGTGLLGAGATGATGSAGIMGAGGMPTQFGGLNPAFNTASYFAPGMQAPVQMVQTPAATEYAMFGGDTASTASNAATQTPPPATKSPLEKGFGSAMEWLSEPKNAMLTGVLGLGALSMFNNQNNETFGDQPVTQAGYSLSPDFKPMRVNPQQYRYRSSYAEGGLTDLDIGRREAYARTAAEPITMMAEGGIAGYARGGDTSKYMAMIDPHTNVQTPDTPDWVRSRGVYHDEDPDTKYQDALTAAQTRMGKAASRANVKLGAMQKPTPMGKLNLGPVVNTEKQKADDGDDDGLAGGGITSLGGYAHGGNARLLRGPGDGMSDDIPASIAGKQPARLADGEFVVPADVVSGLGNGSTEAGAKKLHKMMDKVRVDRTGTKKQGREIKAEKYIPGMAEGGRVEKGIAHFDGGGGAWTDPYLVPTSQGGFLDTGTGGLSAAEVQAMIDAPKETKNATDEPSWKLADPGQFAVGGQNTPDYAVPGYTLTGNLGRWSNIAGEAQRAARPASLNQQVTQSYLNTLGRAPDQQGFNYWMGSGQTGPQIQRGIALSPEASQTSPTTYGPDYISNLYQQYLGRMPDQSGAAYWQGQLGGSMSPTQIASAIQSSPEAQAYQQATQAALAQAQAAQAPAAAPAAATAKRGGIMAVKKGK